MRGATTLAITTLFVPLVFGWGCAASPKPDSTVDSRQLAHTGTKKRQTPAARRSTLRRQSAKRAEHPLIAQLRVWVKRTCACKDLKCVKKAWRAMEALFEEMGKDRPPQATLKVLMELAQRAKRCSSSVAKGRVVAVAVDPTNPLVNHIRSIHKASCACKDRRCARRMHVDLLRFIRNSKPVGQGQAAMDLIARLTLGAIGCLNKLLRAPPPSSRPSGSRQTP